MNIAEDVVIQVEQVESASEGDLPADFIVKQIFELFPLELVGSSQGITEKPSIISISFDRRDPANPRIEAKFDDFRTMRPDSISLQRNNSSCEEVEYLRIEQSYETGKRLSQAVFRYTPPYSKSRYTVILLY